MRAVGEPWEFFIWPRHLGGGHKQHMVTETKVFKLLCSLIEICHIANRRFYSTMYVKILVTWPSFNRECDSLARDVKAVLAGGGSLKLR